MEYYHRNLLDAPYESEATKRIKHYRFINSPHCQLNQPPFLNLPPLQNTIQQVTPVPPVEFEPIPKPTTRQPQSLRSLYDNLPKSSLFFCEHCSRPFTRRYNCERHVRIVHLHWQGYKKKSVYNRPPQLPVVKTETLEERADKSLANLATLMHNEMYEEEDQKPNCEQYTWSYKWLDLRGDQL